MKCDRLISLVKNWYLKVQEESMAPARMVAFMEKHISQCEECLADPDVKQEVEKIREIVLPPSKIPKPKVVRVPKELSKEDKEADETDAAAEEKPEDAEVGDDDENEDEENDEDEDYEKDLLDEDDEI
jgi:hypothetical protein